MDCEISKNLIPDNWTNISKVSTKIDGNFLIAKTPLGGRFSTFFAKDQHFYPDHLFQYTKKHFKVSCFNFAFNFNSNLAEVEKIDNCDQINEKRNLN